MAEGDTVEIAVCPTTTKLRAVPRGTAVGPSAKTLEVAYMDVSAFLVAWLNEGNAYYKAQHDRIDDEHWRWKGWIGVGW